MICSMTAFARQTHLAAWGSLVWELRSVNHRYLEISFRLPDVFRDLETALREVAREYCQRGKLDIILRYQASDSYHADLRLNQPLLKQLTQACTEIKNQLTYDTQLEIGRLLNWPGVVQSVESDFTLQSQAALSSFTEALSSLQQMRQREGSALQVFLQQRLDALTIELKNIQQHLPSLTNTQREKLLNRFAEVQLQLDPQRLEQEMVLFAQRGDISEEIDRLHEHLQEVVRIIKKGGAVGRRLDFLIQELNREVNTISSKINDVAITRSAVEMKVLIEQIREQVQNIE